MADWRQPVTLPDGRTAEYVDGTIVDFTDEQVVCDLTVLLDGVLTVQRVHLNRRGLPEVPND